MTNEASKLRRKLKSIEQGRSDSVDAILRERGPLRKGTLVTVRRKCGKPRCRCTTGEKHAAEYLSVPRLEWPKKPNDTVACERPGLNWQKTPRRLWMLLTSWRVF